MCCIITRALSSNIGLVRNVVFVIISLLCIDVIVAAVVAI